MDTNSQQSRIEAQNLVKSFGGKRVVDDLSIAIASGEIVGLLGPNGAGKTTTFYIMLGLIQASEGRILMNEHSITNLALYQRARLGIGYLPQDASVFRKLSVRDNLVAVAQTLSISRSDQKEKVERALEDFGLNETANQIAYTLSGGERRRLEIARSVLLSPKFLFMDEPFSGVDPINVSEVQEIILNSVAVIFIADLDEDLV
ncbi:MAG: ABC transporter ATP-binding protein, partial [Puniceicoccaceae bacterium]|nr:ABC transporter ATP-binding protein [Puniceicoccaceae bacterium]